MIDEVTLDMVVLQLIPFLITVFGLHVIILKPMLAHLADRERNIDGFKREADLLEEEVSGKLSELEARLSEARTEAQAERARLRAEAKEAEQRILAEARDKTDELVAGARAELAADKAQASKTLEATARSLSGNIAQAILGRPVEGN